jgi:hypothetical protein
VSRTEKRYGLLDSGATQNVRELKVNEDYRGLFPIEVEVAFNSEVKIELLLNATGTIIGPEGTETIVCVSDLVMAGWKVDWTEEGLVISKGDTKLPIEIRSGQSVLPNELCLAFIDEIEEAKSAKMRSMKMADDDFTIKSIWPHLKKALNWLLKNQFEGAAELLATIVNKRRKEIEMEETKTQEQVKLMLEQVSEREKAEVKKVLFEVCCLWRKQQAHVSFQRSRRRRCKVVPPKAQCSQRLHH